MDKLQVQLLIKIGQGVLFLPNAAALLNDTILVVDGGNNRICLLNENGDLIKSIGTKGYSEYGLKEPVAVGISPQNEVVIADWHNHRIVFYDSNLEFLFDYGRFGLVGQGQNFLSHFFSFVGLLLAFGHSGKYLKSHQISPENRRKLNFSGKYLFAHLQYFMQREESKIANLFNYRFYINKPNGAAFNRNQVIITQKNNKCLTVFDRQNNNITFEKNIFTVENGCTFSRLGNIVYINGRFYICEEDGKIIIMDEDFAHVDTIYTQGELENPFSVSRLDANHIVVCGNRVFQIININTKEVEFESEQLGELHGVICDEDRQYLYIVDRFHSVLYQYTFSYL